MRISSLLLLLLIVCVGGCDAPVRIGIEQARAAGINVASPQPLYAGPRPIYASASVPPGAGRPAARPAAFEAAGGLAFLTPVPQPHEAGDIVGLKLEREGAGRARPITFGQVFIPGQLPRDSGLAARMDGHEVPVQLDVKATNPDGSVRFGVVTMTAAAPAGVMLVRHPADAAAPVDLAALRDSYDLTVDLVVHGTSGDEPHHFVAGTLLANALRSGKASFWLRGPLATEARVDVPVTGSLHLTFDIRGYADGSTFTDVQFNNDIAMQPVGGEVKYDATISQNGKPVFQKAAIDQFQYQTWHHEVWSNGDPAVNVVHDVAAMERAGAVWGYDLKGGVARGVLANEQKELAQPGYTDVLNNAAITKYMPMTGGRRDIGPLPHWDAVWLMTQDAGAARFALAQSDAAGAAPWHLFDPTTGTYVTTDKYPKLWIDGRGGHDDASTGLSQPDNGKSGWTLDPAHEPGLSYLAYLATGSRYRLDQLNAQASWTVVAVWPWPRQNGLGIIAADGVQLRGAAWGLRELIEAAYIDPDNTPLKAYFRHIIANNFDYLLTEAHKAHQGEASGWLKADYGYQAGTMAPWQQDFMASTVILAAQQGVPGAKELLTWQAHFLAGRFLAGDKGLSPYDGVSYNMVMWKTTPDEPLQTWREIGAEIVANHWSGGGTTWHEGNTEYYLAARGVLSGIVGATALPEASQALAWLQAHPPAGSDAFLHLYPSWAIVAVPE